MFKRVQAWGVNPLSKPGAPSGLHQKVLAVGVTTSISGGLGVRPPILPGGLGGLSPQY